MSKEHLLTPSEITWFMQEIEMHCKGALIEFEGFLSMISSEETIQTRFVWFHLAAFLSHAAMISKYIDPPGSSDIKSARKKALSLNLQIDLKSPILSREARDNIEHFDERMDNWISSSKSTVIENVFLTRREYDYLFTRPHHVKRILIADELVFISEKRDKSVFELNLVPVLQEICRIEKEASRWVEKNSPYQFLYPV